MTPEEADVVVMLKDQYDTLSESMDDVLAACDTAPPDQAANMKRQFASALRQAFNSYVEAMNRIMGDSAEIIKKVNETASGAQKSIDAALANLTNIKNALNAITAAVGDVAVVVAALK